MNSISKQYSLGVIILAAGKSERMGSPKALLEISGKTFISVMLNNSYLKREAIKKVVVLGHNENQLRQEITHDFEIVVNSDYESGKTGSIQCGVNSLIHKVDGIFIWPVDCPLIEPSVFKKMEKAFLGPDSIIIPSFNMKCGHPPLIGSNFFDSILSFQRDQSLRDLYKNNSQNITHVVVDNPSVLHNINTPDAFEKIKQDYEGNISAP